MAETATQSQSFFLPDDRFNESVRVIGISAVTILLLNQGLYCALLSKDKKKNTSRAFRTAYQITNLLVNLTLGVYGLHVVNNDNSTDLKYVSPSADGIQGHVFGFDQYCIFAALQVGYNLWSLPVGYFFINESLPMIMHHISVLIICTLSATSSYGFRLHAPYFLGVFEISSVPLAVVNYLKDHHEWTMKNCKVLFEAGKVMFSLMFVWYRIILGSPHMYHITMASYWAWGELSSNDTNTGTGTGTSSTIMKHWVGLVFLKICFMAILQYYWAFLIIKSFARMFTNPKKSKKV